MLRFACVFALLAQPVFATDADRADAACFLALRIAEEARQIGADLAIRTVLIAGIHGTESPEALELAAINERQQQLVAGALRDIRRICVP